MDILMPQLGETVAEGKITKWYKAKGDAVKPGDNLFEIETDKTSMEVPATSAGILSDIRVGEGATALVGAVVAVVSGAGDESVHSSGTSTTDAAGNRGGPAPATPTPKGATVPAVTQAAPKVSAPMDPFREVRSPHRNFGPARLAGGTTITPLARRLAGERGIDVSKVKGSGPHGRIVAKDVENAAPTSGRMVAGGATAVQVKALFDGVPYDEVPLDGMRRTIATRLIEAKQTIPHFYLTTDIEIGRLMAMREEANTDAPEGADGKPVFKLSLNDFIVKAWAAALTRVPAANAVWAEDRILRFHRADIGIAVAIEGGLITPVVREADRKPLGALSAEVKALATRARDKKLKPNEYQGGSSAISNLGMYGVREFSAIINPPQATILAVGASRRAPVEAADGSVRFTDVMTVTLSCDHRVVDGALGAELLATFKKIVERPVSALL